MSRLHIIHFVLTGCLFAFSCKQSSSTVEEDVLGAIVVEEDVPGAATAELAAEQFYEALVARDLQTARSLVPDSAMCADTDFEPYCLEETQGLRTFLLQEGFRIGELSISVGEIIPIEPEPSFLAFSLAMSGQPIAGFEPSDWAGIRMFQSTNNTLHTIPVATIEINGRFFCYYVVPRYG